MAALTSEGKACLKMKTILAYLAGVIDSDGTIGVKRSTYHMRKIGDATQAIYSERVCLKQVEPHAVQLLKKYFGGSVYISKPSAKKGKNLFTWQVSDKRAFLFLKAVIPYLRIKKQQAKNCLELRKLKISSQKQRMAFGRGHIGAAHRSQRLTTAMEKRHQAAHLLNSVGTNEL